MAIAPPRVNLDALRLNADPRQPDPHQLLVAAQQQGAMEQTRAMTQMPQTVVAAQQQLDSRDQMASQMAFNAKEAIIALAGPDGSPGKAGVLAMAAQAPEGIDPRVYIMQERLGMA